MGEIDRALEGLACRIGAGATVTVLTGAGVSAASGVPTFRGADGLWRQHRAEDLATPDAFARNPQLVWAWYAWRRERIAACQPNRTHQMLAAWKARDHTLSVVTQNVDGLHERAGLADLVRLHGSIWHLRCWSSCPTSPIRWRDDRVPLPEVPPHCPHCHGLARPDVVWFGEPLDPAVLDAASRAAASDIFISAGTSALVYPAASFLPVARARGAYTVEVNIDDTPASDTVDLVLRERAEVVFDRLEHLLGAR